MHAETPDDQPLAPPPAQPAPAAAVAVANGHETVIKFVLSGPILADRGPHARVSQLAPLDDAANLRERVAFLERGMADAQARLEALSRALAVAVSSATQPVAHDGAWRMPAATASAAMAAGAAAPAAEPYDGLTSVPPPIPLAAGAADFAAAALYAGDHAQLAVAPPYAATPAPQPSTQPKVRGLRRMISVLRHD